MKSWRFVVPTLVLLLSLVLPGTMVQAASERPPTFPPAVTQIDAHAGDYAALVMWNAIPSTTPDGGYRVYAYRAGTNTVMQTLDVPGRIGVVEVGNLVNGQSYAFTVRALIRGALGPESVRSRAVTPGGAQPGAPGNLHFTVQPGGAALSWSVPPSVIDHYVVLVSSYTGGAIDQSKLVQEHLVQGTDGIHGFTSTVSGLAAGTTYLLEVRAVSLSGMLSPASRVLYPSGTLPPPPTAPLAPATVHADAGSGQATVSWATPYDGGSSITSYTVAFSANPGNAATIIHPATDGWMYSNGRWSVTVYGLTNGHAYTFYVYATNAVGTSPAAASNTVTPYAPVRAPDPVRDVHAVAGNGMATVSWLPPGYDGSSPITSYTVAFSANPYDVAAVIYPATDGWMYSNGRWSASVYGLINGHSYTFYIYATNALGTSSGVATNPVTPYAPMRAPDPVVSVTAAAGNGMATVSWLPTFNGGSAVTSYIVAYSANPNDVAAIVNTVTSPQLFNGTRWSTAVYGLTNGRAYTFYVYARNSVGLSPPAASNAVVPLAPIRVPDRVVDVRVVGGNAQATVSWAPPGYDGGSPITSYIVAFSPSPTDVAAVVHPATDGWMFSGGRWSITIGNLVNGHGYTFYVYAVNAAGMSGGAGSNTIWLSTVPSAVRNLVVTPGDASIEARWDPPSSDGGLSIQSYQVRASDGIHAPITLTVTGTSATINGLSNGSAYTVTVSAVNSIGTGSESSAVATPRNLAPTITVPGALSVHHGDVVGGTVTASGPEAADHLILTASGLPAGVTFTDNGNGKGVLRGNAETPAGTYTLSFAVSDGHNAPVSHTMVLTVVREQAEIRLASSAPLSVVLKQATQKKASALTYITTIREVTDPNGYADIGEAADVTYTLTSLQTGATFSGKAATSGHGVEGTLIATYTFRNIPRGIYELHIEIGGSYYQGTAETTVAVSGPEVHGGVTGQGQVQVPGNNDSAAFQIRAQRTAKGALSGSLLYVEPPTGSQYTFRSIAITAIVFKGNTVYIQGHGELNGTGGYQFVAAVVDNHSQGRADRFGLRIIDPTFTTVGHCTFAPVDLGSGQARINHA